MNEAPERSMSATMKGIIDERERLRSTVYRLIAALEKIRQNKCYCDSHGYIEDCPHEVAGAALEEAKP